VAGSGREVDRLMLTGREAGADRQRQTGKQGQEQVDWYRQAEGGSLAEAGKGRGIQADSQACRGKCKQAVAYRAGRSKQGQVGRCR
jgi:hypothetical protein